MKSAAAFIAKAKKIGHDFGVEITIDCYIIDAEKALVMANYPDRFPEKKYFINIPLVAIITKAAVSGGGTLRARSMERRLLSITCIIKKNSET